MTPPRQWLFITGMGREQRYWARFPEIFSAALGGAGVHHLDPPGYGTERNRVSPRTLPEITDDLRRRFLHMPGKPQGPWGLLCISLGGMIGLDWAARFPEDFKALVLINSSANNLSSPWARMRPLALIRLIDALATKDVTAREAKILALTSCSPDAEALHLEDRARLAREKRFNLRNFINQMRAGATFKAPPSVPVPVLALAGRGDALVNPVCSRNLADHYRADLKEHPWAGHELTLDDPEWAARAVKQWLEEKA